MAEIPPVYEIGIRQVQKDGVPLGPTGALNVVGPELVLLNEQETATHGRRTTLSYAGPTSADLATLGGDIAALQVAVAALDQTPEDIHVSSVLTLAPDYAVRRRHIRLFLHAGAAVTIDAPTNAVDAARYTFTVVDLGEGGTCDFYYGVFPTGSKWIFPPPYDALSPNANGDASWRSFTFQWSALHGFMHCVAGSAQSYA